MPTADPRAAAFFHQGYEQNAYDLFGQSANGKAA
jgi:hypothetical protein